MAYLATYRMCMRLIDIFNASVDYRIILIAWKTLCANDKLNYLLQLYDGHCFSINVL